MGSRPFTAIWTLLMQRVPTTAQYTYFTLRRSEVTFSWHWAKGEREKQKLFLLSLADWFLVQHEWHSTCIITSVGVPGHFGALPDLDPPPFFRNFKDVKKQIFHIFSYNLPVPAGTLSSVLKIKFFAKILCYFIPLNTFMRKGKDPDPDLWLMDPDLGGPKTLRILRIWITNTDYDTRLTLRQRSWTILSLCVNE